MQKALPGKEKIVFNRFCVKIFTKKVSYGLGITAIAAAEACEIRAVSAKDFGVFFYKGGIFHPVVPKKENISAGFQNAQAFLPKGIRIKPVKGLGGSDAVHTSTGKSGVFCRSVHRGKARFGTQCFFRFSAHIGVGLHGIHPIAML